MKEYFIYYGTILLAAVFAGLSQMLARDKANKYKLNKVFLLLSILTLIIMMGFRADGLCIDDYNYRQIFNYAKEGRIWEYFAYTKIEPGYLIFNRLVSFFANDYQAIIFITSLIPIILFYKAIVYERKNVNLFLLVYLFGTIMYIYFYGITRLFIAASIIAYSYRYIFEKNTRKYLICVLIASMFHYSALFMLSFLYFTTEKEGKPRSKKKFIAFVSIAIPTISLIFVKVIIPALGSSKYGYSVNDNMNFSLGDFDKLILIFLALLFRKQLKAENERIDIYIVMFILAFVITLSSVFIDTGRLQWYLMFSICIILPSIVRTLLKTTEYKGFVVLLIPLIMLYGAIYTYRIIFLQPSNESMRNYSNILFIEKEE